MAQLSGKPFTRRQILTGLGSSLALSAVPQQLIAQSLQPIKQTRPIIMTPQAGKAPLLGKGLPETAVWQFNNQVPGTELRVRQGDWLNVKLVNKLKQTTTIHWHGIRIDNKMDGVAHLTQEGVKPSESFDYRFRLPDAGTYWYHPHDKSWEQVARGLYGLLIVEEKTPPKVDRDLAFALDDWWLKKNGQLDEASFGNIGEWAHGGRTGNVLSVNGKPNADIFVQAGERLRVRLCSTANARILQLRIQGCEATLIALDGQPLSVPRPVTKDMALPPGARADLILDMTQNPGGRAVIAETSNLRVPLINFRYHYSEKRQGKAYNDVVALPPNPLTAPSLTPDQKVTLDMTGGAMGGMAKAIYKGKEMPIGELVDKHNMIWALNGVAGMPEKPLFLAKKGQTIEVRMLNNTAFPHVMHFHGHHVLEVKRVRQTRKGRKTLLSRDDWRDSVLMDRSEEVTVTLVADNPGKWMLHCHMLEHQAGGMMTWFEVGV